LIVLLHAFILTPATPEIYTLSLHDALPICEIIWWQWGIIKISEESFYKGLLLGFKSASFGFLSLIFLLTSRPVMLFYALMQQLRSEEHTSELQSRFDLVCRLLLEKKKYKRI